MSSEYSMMFFTEFFRYCRGLFHCRVSAEIVGLSLVLYLSDPLVAGRVVPYTSRVFSWLTSAISPILSACSFSEIGERVIGAISVLMIYLSVRPPAVAEEPRKAMGTDYVSREAHRSVGALPLSFSVRAIPNSVALRSTTHSVEVAGGWVVANELKNIFNGDIWVFCSSHVELPLNWFGKVYHKGVA